MLPNTDTANQMCYADSLSYKYPTGADYQTLITANIFAEKTEVVKAHTETGKKKELQGSFEL